MVGQYDVRVYYGRLVYEFSVKRNFTVIYDDSGTGKSTLVEAILDYHRNKYKSVVKIECELEVNVLLNYAWDKTLQGLHDSIILIDDTDIGLVKQLEFLNLAMKSNNYFVFITRDSLPNIPYSVMEITQLSSYKI